MLSYEDVAADAAAVKGFQLAVASANVEGLDVDKSMLLVPAGDEFYSRYFQPLADLVRRTGYKLEVTDEAPAWTNVVLPETAGVTFRKPGHYSMWIRGSMPKNNILRTLIHEYAHTDQFHNLFAAGLGMLTVKGMSVADEIHSELVDHLVSKGIGMPNTYPENYIAYTLRQELERHAPSRLDELDKMIAVQWGPAVVTATRVLDALAPAALASAA